VEQAADRKAAQAVGREAQLLADLDCKCRDATRVLLRRGVLRAEPNHERPHAGAEERLLCCNELGRPQVTDQRARAAPAAKVVHERGADDEDAEQLEDVAEPPAEVHEREDQGAVEPGSEEDDAEHDREVRGASREQERVHRANREGAVEREPDGEESDRRGRAGRRHARHERRHEGAEQAQHEDAGGEHALHGEHAPQREPARERR